jgi:hypothetical protein
MTMKNDKPNNVEMALEMMRFGCPFIDIRSAEDIGVFDVKRYERRMAACADMIEKEIKRVKDLAMEFAVEKNRLKLLGKNNEYDKTLRG